ncbi:MAG: Fic family protein [Elusimicrobia bacterium]|nr:Fic family protein [Elusimicrobiota bacterium]
MVIIGRQIQQNGGYKAFIPECFPPIGFSFTEPSIIKLLADTNLLLGKLDGITKLLPDIDFFIFMYINKEAAYSSQVEGTKAKLTDALQAEVEKTPELPPDVDDILHYIKAMNEGLKKLEKTPLSLRLIKQVHATLLTKARSSHFAYPGEFRKSQNWIAGNSPLDARFVPPPPQYVIDSMGQLEKYFYSHENIPALIKAGLIHSQFETIHPFNDGNGRTGRLLITFYLCQQNILEKPVLYFSEYFKKHRDVYFSMLEEYRNGNVNKWLEFFLKGIANIAVEAIKTSQKIVQLREKDLLRISGMGKTGKYAMTLLKDLYKTPIINVKKIQEVTGLSREGANRLATRFMNIGILLPKDKNIKYGRLFIYKEYLNLFDK